MNNTLILIWLLIGFVSSYILITKIKKYSNYSLIQSDVFIFLFSIITSFFGVYMSYMLLCSLFYKEDRIREFVKAMDSSLIWHDDSMLKEYKAKYKWFKKKT